MSETYCGKSCEGCAYKEKLECPGCKSGPGKYWSCDCELAKCCKEKGHETCDTCSFKETCETLRGRENIPEHRLKKRVEEVDRKARVVQKAAFLGKWLWILFWLVIPGALGSFMTVEGIVKLFPAFDLPGQVINILCSAAYGLILLNLTSAHDNYRISGICCLVTTAVSAVVLGVTGGSDASWALILTIPAAIVGLVGEYHEYIAHAGVLRDVDAILSQDWRKLWKWYIRMMAAIIGSVIVMLIVPPLGFVGVLVSAIGIVVVSIMKLVYLYRTAKVFRQYVVK